MRVWIFMWVSLVLVSCDCGEEKGGERLWTFPEPEDWTAIQFGGEGEVRWSEGVLSLDAGVELTGAHYEGSLPEMPYELELEARKVSGADFFCGLTFPLSSPEECVTLIMGGWGGGTVGISSVDGMDASENETTTYGDFEQGRWYEIRIRVERECLSVFLDGKQVVDLETRGKNLGLRPGVIESCAPLGVAAWQTASEIRRLRWRSLGD